MNSIKALALLVVLATGAFTQGNAEEADPLISPNGYRAEFVRSENEGEGTTVISKDGEKIAEIALARPVSFSPVGDVLLVREAMADDDTRQNLLDVGAGEFVKEGERLDYIFGSRYLIEATWSDDGKKITIVDLHGGSEEFVVAAVLSGSEK